MKRFRTLYPNPLVCEDTTPALIGCLDAAGEMASDIVLCCNPESAFVPDHIFQAALATHLESRADYTFVDGLPRNIRIGYFRLRALIELQTTSGGAERPATLICEAVVGKFTTNDAHRCHIARHQVCLQQAPETLVIETRWDVQAAARVVAAEAADPLAVWMRVSAEPRQTPLFAARPKREGTLRVLFFSAHSGYSGAESALIQMVAALDKLRVDPVAFIPMDGLFADGMRQAGCPVLNFEADVRSAVPENLVVLNTLMEAVQPDVIHINAPSGLPVLSAAAVRSIPCVQHLRTVPTNSLSDPLGAIAARIAVSEYIRRLADDQSNIHVIPDGVDTSYFVPDPFARAQARLALALPASAFVILVAARIDPRKRHDLLLEAMHLLQPLVPEALLLIAGDDADNPEWARNIDRLIATSCARQCVRRLGFQRDMKPLYAAADVLVACGDAEPLGCSVLESMSMALPVVISSDGGQTELIDPGRSGLLFPSGDAVQLADRLLLLRDSDLRTTLGTAARERIRKNFSIEVTASDTLKVLENTARSNQASSIVCPGDSH